MNSQRPAALADMSNIMAVRADAVRAGPDLRGSVLARLTALSEVWGHHAKVGRVPPVQPQPVLAPLTPAAIFLVVTINEGGEATVHDALPQLSGLVRAIGFRDPTKRLSAIASIGSHAWDRFFGGARPPETCPCLDSEGPRTR